MEIIIVVGVLFSIIGVWLNILASIAVRYDHTLKKNQKIGQLVFVWAIPFIGACFVLHLIFDHSPDVIPRSWIPWPFKRLVYGKALKPNPNRDDNEIDYRAGSGDRHHHD